METARPYLIALDGRSGSGKSSLASLLANQLSQTASVAILRLEDLYHGWDGLQPALDLYSGLLEQLAHGRTASWSLWDWDVGALGARTSLDPAEVVIVEGVGAAHRQVRDLLDLSIWLQAPPEVRKQRALRRDGQTYAPHWARWAAQEEDYLSRDDIPSAADLVLDADGPHTPFEQLLGLSAFLPARLRDLLPPAAPASAAPPLAGHHAAPADAATLFEALAEGLEHAALLESTSHHLTDPLDRNKYSLIALAVGDAYPLLQSSSVGTTVQRGGASLRLQPGFFESLQGLWPAAGTIPDHYPLPAWVGYLGYELKREVGSDTAPATGHRSGRPDAGFFAPNIVLVINHRTGQMAIHAPVHLREWITEHLAGAGVQHRLAVDLQPVEFTCADTEQGYKDKIACAQQQIYEGNTYEVCLTTELTATVARYSPFEAYCRMRTSSPAPFAHYLRMGRTEVASISPERFLSLGATGLLRAEPIKGTRPRGATVPEDLALKQDLATSPKDRAENIMIVDLLRNDLSHHAVPGSVRVARLCAVESYATVHQMVSTIDAQLRDPALSAQALREAFPPGSMTGAPKLSTMQILDELEEQRERGLYSGAVGYLGADGSADFSVVIRTLVCDRTTDDGWRLSLGLGGAITADSEAQDEWDEVITKSVGVLSALGSTFPNQPMAAAGQ